MYFHLFKNDIILCTEICTEKLLYYFLGINSKNFVFFGAFYIKKKVVKIQVFYRVLNQPIFTYNTQFPIKTERSNKRNLIFK